MKTVLLCVSGLCASGESSLVSLNKSYFLNIPTLRKLGAFRCCGENESFEQIASCGCVNIEMQSKFDQHSLLLAGEKIYDFENLFGTLPNFVLNLIEDIFKTNSLYNKSGSVMQAIKECGNQSLMSGKPICCFENGKSVINFLIHEKTMKKETFFEYVELFSRELKDAFYEVNAVVFAGEPNSFYKTQFSKKIVVAVKNSNVLKGEKVVGIGDILSYAHEGCFDEVYPTKADELSLKLTLREILNKQDEFIYAELGDLEKVHLDKGDLLGARKYLENLDENLAKMVEKLADGDKLILVSTTEKQNVSVPFFIYQKGAKNVEDFGKLKNHAYINRQMLENA